MNFEKLLVATKFAPPRIGARYIVRKQLLEALRRERGCKLLLVPGSAGFGKTILLAQWRQELMKDGLQVAWLSLGPDERQLAGFSTHLFAALGKLGISLGAELLVLSDHGRTDAVVAAIVNQLTTIAEDLYLILDDYHHVEDPLAHGLLQKLVEFSPGNLHVVIASRALPPISVGRLRVMGQVAEVDCADLPFDLAETRAFLEQALGAHGFSADELREIQDVTHGWPACVQLLAIMLRNRPEHRTALHDLAWRSSDLQNYLSQDVVDRLPPEVGEFMESLSICRRFNAELAAAVSGREDAADILRRIEEENLLISRVESDDRSPWFRFHPLFAEFLSARLQRRGRKAVEALHRLASAWCSGRGLIIEGVRHAGMGGDIESAVMIFERAAPATWRLGHFAPMLHLLNTLSEETVKAHPRLLLLASLATGLTGRPGKAAALAEQFKDSGGAEGPAGAFRVALLDALIAFQRDETSRVVELLERFQAADATTALERYVYLSTYGYSLAAAGRYADAHRLLDDNPPSLPEQNEELALITECCRTPWRLLEGRASDAYRLGEPVYARAMAILGVESAGGGLLATAWAETLYELDRLDEAGALIANRLDNLASYPTAPVINAALSRARILHLQESAEAALKQLEEYVRLFRSMGLHRGVALALGEKVRLALSLGDRVRAGDAEQQLRDVAAGFTQAEGFLGDITAAAGLAKARLARHDRAYDAALAALEGVRAGARRRRRGRTAAIADVLRAIVLNLDGRCEEALEALAETLEQAAPLGLVRSVLDEGPPMRELLELLPATRLSPAAAAYRETLLTAFGSVVGSAGGLVDAKGKTPLTPRELEILGLVATGMSNKRIALTLNITLETVKWNLKNVFLKLSVSSRYDAMIWARRQGLIV